MPLEKDKILEFNQYMKSDKVPYIIYAHIESLIKKIDGCANYPENSLTTKIGEHISCGYLMSTIWAFDHRENKHTLYRRKEKILWVFKGTRNKYNWFWKEKSVTVNKRRIKITSGCKSMLYFQQKNLKKSSQKDKYHYHYTDKYRGPAHSICNLKFNVSNEIPAVFHNGSNYDYNFIIN